ncbi:MAG: glucokinase [Rhodospirillales bacterium]|nr:glucokinase [Alphaproteobacteria bacterium]MCB9981854.1 glucokinase [Rhodospirillales bacterium]
MSILADIGGTYARFAVSSPESPEKIAKYEAVDFKNLQEALAHYCQEHALKPSGPLRIAAAGSPENGLWAFVNKNTWIIDPKELEGEGWQVERIVNDFEAAAWSLLVLEGDDLNVVRSGAPASPSKCILGPGTGLGLAYVHQGDRPVVQPTHGGHLPVACLTDEQVLVIQAVQRLKNNDTIAVYENVVSGPGLYNLYRALCLIGGSSVQVQSPEEMLQRLDDLKVSTALRLFHEFLGLFAASSVIAGHAYGGLYLTGGVLGRLIEAGQFDQEHFKRWFCLHGIAPVTRDLRAMPIYHITYLYPALKGLNA